jgi:hypothetical protein
MLDLGSIIAALMIMGMGLQPYEMKRNGSMRITSQFDPLPAIASRVTPILIGPHKVTVFAIFNKMGNA